MKSKKTVLCASVAVGALMVGTCWGANVALNAPVTAIENGSSISNPGTPLSVVTDGIFAPEDTAYGSSTGVQDAVEWGGAANGGAPDTGLVLQIDLGGNYTITGAIVQADDNDSYLLQYFDEADSTWQTLYNVPEVSVGFGLRTRPNADQTTYAPVGPIVTDSVRFSAVSGDGGYAVSEIELEGSAVSAPDAGSTAAMLGGGLALVGLLRRRLLGY